MEKIRLKTMKGVLLWNVWIRDNATKKELHIKVPANTNEEATHLLVGLFGNDAPYSWLGTEPLYGPDTHSGRK